MKIHEIPGKMFTQWESDVKSILDTWIDYDITLDEFKKIFAFNMKQCTENGGIALIADSSKAEGVFSQEIQEYITKEVFHIMYQKSIRYFINIKPEIPGLTSLTVRRYSANGGPSGIKIVDVGSVDDAKLWLRTHAFNEVPAE
ncbi:MAG: hypothetical protein AAGA66_10895 [Bacteroidota bacterium]